MHTYIYQDLDQNIHTCVEKWLKHVCVCVWLDSHTHSFIHSFMHWFASLLIYLVTCICL